MSFIDKLSARLPFAKKEVQLEYYFALNIGNEELTAALWTIEGKELKVLETASDSYSSIDDIANTADKLLDAVLGIREIEPQKILFGVPSSWLLDDNLKDENLKTLRTLVKELELSPMAYVSTANALIHFLEKSEGVPTTAILAGFEQNYITTTVARAGKLDGVKIVKRTQSSGVDLEKALLTFSSVETLPSKILIYDSQTNLEKLKSQLLSYSWMSKLSFLHFPKIDILGESMEIKSVCLAGASEINPNVLYKDQPVNKQSQKPVAIDDEEAPIEAEKEIGGNFGFMVGDVSEEENQPEAGQPLVEKSEDKTPEVEEGMEETEMALPEESNLLEVEDFDQEVAPVVPPVLEKDKPNFIQSLKNKINFKKILPKRLVKSPILLGVIALFLVLIGAYLFLPKAYVKIYVEPKILEKDAQVIADPNQKTVDENAKIIPGEIISTQVSGTAKDSATGRKQVGNSAKGTVVIYNKTFDSKSLSKGTVLTSSNGFKFTLDSSVNIASQSASDSGITFGKTNANATASTIGADGNIATASELTISGFSSSQLSAKSEGNFSGGTSQEVTVVSSDDQSRLLAKLSSQLRQQAQQQLQEKLVGKKILQEALTEQITKKNYSKNINDQASEFSLTMSASYKGTAFNDADLRLIVSKLVTTQVPDGFTLDLSATETQADVSNVDKAGKVVFLAKFKAKLIPKLDSEKIKNQIKGKSSTEADNFLKSMENVLGSDIKITPSLPKFLQRLPILTKNITIEVGLK